MKILFVPGIISRRYWLYGWERDLKKAFPKTEVKIMQRFYVPAWLGRIRKFVKTVEAEINATDEDTLILAHSFGGLVSKKALEKVKRKNIKLVTLATPHTASWLTRWGEVEAAKKRLKVPRKCDYLCKTYGGHYDPIVFADISHVKDVPHEECKTLHQGFLADPRIRKKVIEECLRPLSKTF